MSKLMDNIEYLSKSIGPHPAGTEEEQQASFYIADEFQKGTEFSTSVDEFEICTNVEKYLIIPSALLLVITLLNLFIPTISLFAFILTLIVAAIFVMELSGRSIFSRVFQKGESQNIVTKYQPSLADGDSFLGKRRRKIIVFAHYDTAKVNTPITDAIENMKIPFKMAFAIASVLLVLFTLIKIFVGPNGGIATIILNILIIVSLLVCLVPGVNGIMQIISPYNEGAVNNNTGISALLEIARRIAKNSVSDANIASMSHKEKSIHGEETAREMGLIPDEAVVEYQTDTPPLANDYITHTSEERIISAKAALAAFTGKPVEQKVYTSVAENLVHDYEPIDENNPELINDREYNPQTIDSSESQNSVYSNQPVSDNSYTSYPSYSQPHEKGTDIEGFSNAPSWFVAAQENAKRHESAGNNDHVAIKRSKYTEAMENIEKQSKEQEEKNKEEEIKKQEEALKEQKEAIQKQEEALEKMRIEARAQYNQQLNVVSEPKHEYQDLINEANKFVAEIENKAEDNRSENSEEELTSVEENKPSLPSETTAMEAIVPHEEVLDQFKQKNSKNANSNPSLSALIPKIENEKKKEENTDPSKSSILRKIRSNIPSLSGIIDMGNNNKRPSVKEKEEEAREVKEKLSKLSIPSIEEDVKEIPQKIKNHSIPKVIEEKQEDIKKDINEIKQKQKQQHLKRVEDNNLEDTPQQWLDVEEDFEAQKVGRDRGSWKSFNEEESKRHKSSNGNWNGGSFSRKQLGHVNMLSGQEDDVENELAFTKENDEILEEIEDIYHFRNVNFETEIWFVGIGANQDTHDGIKAFLKKYKEDLKGAIMIEVESLGVGELSVASDEGDFIPTKASSRVKHFIKDAVANTGISPTHISLVGSNSISNVIQEQGMQSMHFFGAENNKPSLKGSKDDVLENIDEMLLEEQVNFIYELLKDKRNS